MLNVTNAKVWAMKQVARSTFAVTTGMMIVERSNWGAKARDPILLTRGDWGTAEVR